MLLCQKNGSRSSSHQQHFLLDFNNRKLKFSSIFHSFTCFPVPLGNVLHFNPYQSPLLMPLPYGHYSQIPREAKFRFDPVSGSLTHKVSRRPIYLGWDMVVQLGNRRTGHYDRFQLIPEVEESYNYNDTDSLDYSY